MIVNDRDTFIKDLMMGDRFRFPGDITGTVYGPVRCAESDYMLQGTRVDFGGGDNMDRHAFTRVEITSRAPKCPCGRFFELCENECEWPDSLEELFAKY
ncbi:hypothetical protein [Streptomyces sp. NPDC051662]|uniref:hypothetical protein n=1 Tax=Streptomyces sp. NPDC051662 TaxID=3154750 RepID=UPI00342B363D